jgi:hypothetical protein
MVGALPHALFEAAGGTGAGAFILDCLQRGPDIVAQLAEPGLGCALLFIKLDHGLLLAAWARV